MKLYIVNEFPKSGGTWLSQMLSEALGIPYPRNRLPMLRSSIIQGHYLKSWNMSNVVVIWRDGRDLTVSQYYHCLFENEIGNKILVNRTRKNLMFNNYNNIRENMPQFINYTFALKSSPRFSWSDFAEAWYKLNNAVHVKYEDLLKDTTGELIRVVKKLSGNELFVGKARDIAEKYSFEKLSGRKQGQENKFRFLRKGIAGDWKNYFNKEARELFDFYAGDQLLKLGYEKDRSWV